jgi:hypothetical protein
VAARRSKDWDGGVRGDVEKFLREYYKIFTKSLALLLTVTEHFRLLGMCTPPPSPFAAAAGNISIYFLCLVSAKEISFFLPGIIRVPCRSYFGLKSRMTLIPYRRSQIGKSEQLDLYP